MAKRPKKYFQKRLPRKTRKKTGPNIKKNLANKSRKKSNSSKKRKREKIFSRNLMSLFFRQSEINMEDCSEKSFRDFDALENENDSNESQSLNYFDNLAIGSNELNEINQSF